jgi:hypothetical protein
MSIKIYLTEEEKQRLIPGRYYIAVKVKIPEIVAVGPDEDTTNIEPSLDHQNRPTHSDGRVLTTYQTQIIADITDHPDCPSEKSVKAADEWLAKHYRELDAALRARL